MRDYQNALKASRRWKKTAYAQRKKLGICLHHGKRKAVTGRTCCEECLEDARLRNKLRS